MALLISTGISGFLASAKKTGKKTLNKAGEWIYEWAEDFVSGLAGHGWKIYRTVAGFFRLEIDEIVIRRTMTVYELLISKIRSIKGAQVISQGNGKIKEAKLSADGLAYLVTLEEEDMSYVEHDFMRCQQFTGVQKLYHVEIESVAAGVIRVPLTEFDKDAGGTVLNPPSAGDEVVQFGNSSHEVKYAGRHSAIYMHADESGQPAIDVMFDLYSKNWDGCVKIRLGGDIPGGNGTKGFYCQNGMIISVNDKGEAVYEFSPDGSFSLAKGKIVYDQATDKVSLSGITLDWKNITNAPTPESGKDGQYVDYQYAVSASAVTAPTSGFQSEMPGVPAGSYLWVRTGTVIPPATAPVTWSAAVRMTGADGTNGTDANLLPWVKEYDDNKTQIGGECLISPKMFSGTNSGTAAEPVLTGVAMGKDCITIGGVKRTGFFAVVNNKVVFEMDPITKRYLFKGRIEADEGTFTGKVNAESGKIGSLNIVGNALTNEGFNDDSYIILRNDNAGKESFVGIGGNMYPATMGGARASARFECTGKNDSSNTALYLRAANASGPGAHNIALDMQGEILTRGSNGAGYFGKTVDVDIFDGWINGIKNVRLKFFNGILVDWVNI